MRGHRPQVVDESQVVELLDSLSLDNNDDRSLADGDSDTSEDIASDPQPPCRSNTPLVQSGTTDFVQSDEKSLVQDVSSSDSVPFSKAAKWNSSDRFRRGSFKSCVVDVSATVASAAEINTESQQSTGEDLLSGSGSKNAGIVRHTCNSSKLQENVAREQTTLERVKACLYEWKAQELVAFLRTDPSKPTRTEEDVAAVEEVNENSAENNVDKREETGKLYAREVGEFYGQKPRVRFADTCKQVVNFLTAILILSKI